MMANNAEAFGVKLTFDGQMRRFPLAKGTSFAELRNQVVALLGLQKDADILLKYSDEEGDLITISSDLELNSALVPGTLLRLTAFEKKTAVASYAPAALGMGSNVGYPSLDAIDTMMSPVPTAPVLVETPRGFEAHPHPPPSPEEYFGPRPGMFGAGPHGGRGRYHHPHHPHHPHHHRGEHHGPRGGHFGPRGGFHGMGAHPYSHPMFPGGRCGKEEWKEQKHAAKEMRREMKKQWKEAHKNKEFVTGEGMRWGWAPNANERFVATFAKDVTIPDGTPIPPNTPFVKTWRLRNEGAEWPAGCVLRFLGKHSDNMGGAETTPLPNTGPVAPNTEVDVSVALKSPEKPGRYTGYYKMCTPDGRKFGQRVWLSIVVPGVASSSSSSSDSDKEADKYEALVDAVLATGIANVKRHRVFRMLQKNKGDVNLVCEKLAQKEEKRTRKQMKKHMKI